MKPKEETLSRRYASAFLNLYQDRLTDDLVELLPGLADQLESIRSIILYAQIALVNGTSQEDLDLFFEQAGFKKKFMPLVVELTRKKRLTLLPRVLRSIYTQYLERNGILHFTIESAVPLTQEELDGFITFLKEKTDKKIQYTLKPNPDLIAGVKIYSDTLAFEHSVQQQLEQIVPR